MALALGHDANIQRHPVAIDLMACFILEGEAPELFDPHFDWRTGGPIIEREKIEIGTLHDPNIWYAQPHEAVGDFMDRINRGSTPLIAAMRCFVASKLGEEVEIP